MHNQPLIRWYDSPEIKAQESQIAWKERALAEARSRQENAEAQTGEVRATVDNIRSLVAIGRKNKQELDRAEAALREVQDVRTKAKGETITLADELRVDRLSLEHLRIETARQVNDNIRAQTAAKCEELEDLVERVWRVNRELDELYTAARLQFEANGPGGEFTKAAAVPIGAGFGVSLACNHVTKLAVEQWRTNWRDAVGHAERITKRLQSKKVA
jgi:DNA repair exonuclease SbcCD ATPase subunit